MTRKSGLGKGLDALIPPSESALPASGITQIPVASISSNPRQPRNAFDESELAELAAWKARIAPWLAPSEHPDRWNQLAAAYVSVSLLARHVALSNPLLDFTRLLLVKRRLAPGDHSRTNSSKFRA